MALPKVTLYMSPGSCALAPEILLHHAGIPFKAIGVPLKDIGTHLSSTNPKAQVPVLILNDETITEVPAIAQAINQLNPEAHIFGRTPMQFVRVCELLNFLSASVHAQSWGPFARPWRFTDEPAAEAGVKRQAEAKVREKLALLEAKLPEKGFAVGEDFTAADAYMVPISNWARDRAGFDIDADYPKWSSLVKRARELPGIQAALQEESRIAQEMGL
jgi:glutathione S-transferase